MLKSVYPPFKNFNQIKQIIPIEYLDRILDLLQDYSLNNINDEYRIILEIENSELTGAEKKALVKIRINQGIFRDKLLKRYKSCCCVVLEILLLLSQVILNHGQNVKQRKNLILKMDF